MYDVALTVRACLQARTRRRRRLARGRTGEWRVGADAALALTPGGGRVVRCSGRARRSAQRGGGGRDGPPGRHRAERGRRARRRPSARRCGRLSGDDGCGPARLRCGTGWSPATGSRLLADLDGRRVTRTVGLHRVTTTAPRGSRPEGSSRCSRPVTKLVPRRRWADRGGDRPGRGPPGLAGVRLRRRQRGRGPGDRPLRAGQSRRRRSRRPAHRSGSGSSASRPRRLHRVGRTPSPPGITRRLAGPPRRRGPRAHPRPGRPRIGARTPAEIAVSVLAEALAVRA